MKPLSDLCAGLKSSAVGREARHRRSGTQHAGPRGAAVGRQLVLAVELPEAPARLVDGAIGHFEGPKEGLNALRPHIWTSILAIPS